MIEKITFESIRSAYTKRLLEHRDIVKRVETKIEIREKQLRRLRQKQKAYDAIYPRWTEMLLRPLLMDLYDRFPEYKWDGDSLTPLGLGNRVLVFFIKDNTLPETERYDVGNSIYMCFQPGALEKGELMFETGEKSNSFKKGTVGEINGFNNITCPVEYFEQVIEFMKLKIRQDEQPTM